MPKKVYINRFDGGMTNDPQESRENFARVSKHIDNYTRPHAITTHADIDFDAITDPNSSANFDSYRIQKFVYAATGFSTNAFWGLGVQAGTTKPAIYTKATIGAAWALANTTGDYASLVATGEAQQFLVIYQDYLWGIDNINASRNWWKYGPLTGTPTWTRALHAGNVNISSPVVHSKGIMYFGYGTGTLLQNRVGKNDSGVFTDSVLVLPTLSKIPSLTEYNNYLAVAANNPDDTSSVFLWDTDATSWNEKIDWGSGTIKWIRNIGGTLVACSVLQPSALSSAPTVSFKYYNGNSVTEFHQFTCTSATIYNDTQLYNNIVYFMGEVVVDGETLSGIWRVMKHNDGHLSVSFDRLPKIDTAPDAGTLYGFMRTGDYFHVAAQYSGAYVVSKTLSTYTTTAKYITPKYNGGDISKYKKLIRCTIMTEPLSSTGAVLLKYKADGESSYTTIFTNANITAGSFIVGREYTITSIGTTDFTFIGASANTVGLVFTATGVGVGTGKAIQGSTSYTAINIESTAANLPRFKQIQFSIEPTNATVLGYSFEYDEIDSNK